MRAQAPEDVEENFKAFIDATEIPRPGQSKAITPTKAYSKDTAYNQGTKIHRTQQAMGTIMMCLRRVT
ncbi:MAG: hypothetical protein QXV38_02950 [Conexivisphaerales archaeon]